MSDLLSIGASGLRAYQSALGTVSENIANAGTVGYSRRTTGMAEVLATGGGVVARASTGGMGVVVTGINRSADLFRAAAVRTAGADLARTQAGAVWLERIEGALSGNQLDTRITAYFTAARALAADPASVPARAAMLEQAGAAAGAFAATGAAMAQVAADLDAHAGQAVDQLNPLGTALAKVNAGLSRAAPGSTAAAGLADQRDQLLEQMSAIVDVGVTIDAAGRASVRVGGAGGAAFVTGQTATRITLVRNDEGAVSFAADDNGTLTGFAPGGGTLAGIGEGMARVADAQAALDRLATDFSSGVNSVQANGRDLDGQPGTAIFAAGDPPTALSVILADPRGIAAAGAAGGERDNANLAALEALRTTGHYEARVTALVSTNAAALAQRRTVAEAQGAILDGAVAARDQVSAVDLDEEAVSLLRFQQAYQASSRVIQIARETLDSILQIR